MSRSIVRPATSEEDERRGVYVRTKSVVEDRLREGLAAPYVDDFTAWLRHRRYTEKTIVERIRYACPPLFYLPAPGETKPGECGLGC